jgi:hypothetical protein
MNMRDVYDHLSDGSPAEVVHTAEQRIIPNAVITTALRQRDKHNAEASSN